MVTADQLLAARNAGTITQNTYNAGMASLNADPDDEGQPTTNAPVAAAPAPVATPPAPAAPVSNPSNQNFTPNPNSSSASTPSPAEMNDDGLPPDKAASTPQGSAAPPADGAATPPADSGQPNAMVHGLIYGKTTPTGGGAGSASLVRDEVANLKDRADQLTGVASKAADASDSIAKTFQDQTAQAASDLKIGADKAQAELDQQARDQNDILQDSKDKLQTAHNNIAKAMAQDIDPQRFLHSRNTGQMISGIIGMAAGGFLAGEGRTNPAAEMIKQATTDDINAQVQDKSNNLKLLGMDSDLDKNMTDTRMKALTERRDRTIATHAIVSNMIDKSLAAYKDNANAQTQLLQLKAGLQNNGIKDVGTLNDQIFKLKQAQAAAAAAPGLQAAAQQQKIKERVVQLKDKFGLSQANAEAVAFAENTGAQVPGSDTPFGGKANAGNARTVRLKTQLAGDEDAVMRLGSLLKHGSSLNLTQRAQAAQDAALLRQHGYQGIPENPLELFSVSGPRYEALGEVLHNIKAQQKVLDSAPAGSANPGADDDGSKDDE